MFTTSLLRINMRDRTTAQRLLDEGLRLFAAQGYRRTTVGQIEAAAGLSPRSGALYKHFGSKQELLAAAVERHLQEVEGMRGVLDLMPLGDLKAELTLLARWLLADLDRHRELFLLFEKEGADLPELRDRYYEEVGEFGYRLGAEFIERSVFAHTDEADIDAEVLAAITMNALVNQRRSEWTFGRKPLGLSDEALIEGVVLVLLLAARASKDQRPPP
jgi:AcrR family transcriptional regulator